MARPKSTLPLTERFWAKVDKSGECWLWKGGVMSNGYGNISVDGKNERVHRLSWELHHGTIPPGKDVLHKCDNSICVNPGHLYLGSDKDNMHDREVRHRHPHKATFGSAILTPVQVHEIKGLLAQHITVRQLAAKYGVSYLTIASIKNGHNWRWVK